ncbi:MAG: hypothetical protein A2142_02025 [candidate division Zixibacteria bacterium RBG_16_48_11]|nr:MAG: hypothetical protein A2142_02025 [candidate division Zixibacteria bacterium RBG_16_48_11]
MKKVCLSWALSLIFFFSAEATIRNVSIFDFGFNPASITVSEGDTVKWTNTGSSTHTSTSDDGFWSSPFLGAGATYQRQFDSSGTFPYHCVPHPSMMGTVQVDPTDVKDELSATLPKGYELFQNHPNPFNANTVISYRLPFPASVTLTVFNILGQVVRTYNLGQQSAGLHSTVWDGTSESGIQVGTGIYLYKLKAGEFVQVRRMALLK